MTDHMRASVLEPDSPCKTPNFQRLAAAGVRFRRAYTPNAICSPARASLMTGLLPHNHGVLEVIHCVDPDQCNLRTQYPHWAQRLAEAGYKTGYFGKWHVERTENLKNFGWQTDGGNASRLYKEHRAKVLGSAKPAPHYSLSRTVERPPGYRKSIFYGVTDQPPETRPMGITTSLALTFLEEAVRDSRPWCCFVSVNEPHDPYVAGQKAFAQYDVDAIKLPPNVHDDLSGRPNVYRKVAETWSDFSDREKREAAACYYACITEIDQQFGKLIDFLQKAGKFDDTIVLLTSDHGDLVGAHGLFCKNFTAFEEIYNIPLVMCGPGIAKGAVTQARVGLHDLCPTLLEMVGAPPITAPDCRSFAPVLSDPKGREAAFTTGYAEYHGGRYNLTQRILWDGPWKFVLNGFDFDELYNLDEDPFEMKNLANDPAHQDRVRDMMAKIWMVIRDTNDHKLFNAHYPGLRAAPFGPLIIEP
jgi:arylsulfatase A-like enzyme